MSEARGTKVGMPHVFMLLTSLCSKRVILTYTIQQAVGSRVGMWEQACLGEKGGDSLCPGAPWLTSFMS